MEVRIISQFVENVRGSGVTYEVDSVVDTSEAKARAWEKGGLCVVLSPNTGQTSNQRQAEVETATQEAPEKAVTRSAKGGGRKKPSRS